MRYEMLTSRVRRSMSDAAKILGRNLRSLREQSGMTQAQLAEKLGVNPSAIAHWEIGRSFAGGEQLDRLAQVFGMTHADLLIDDASQRRKTEPQVIAPVSLYEALRVVNENIDKLVIKKKPKSGLS